MREPAAMTEERPRLRLVRPDEVPPAVARARADRGTRRTLAALTISAGALTVIGLVMVLSASSVAAYAQQGSSFFFFKRQIASAVVGLVAFFLAARMPYDGWRKAWGPLAGITLVLLVLVFHSATGQSGGGSARWIAFGPVTLQPSELAKFVVVIASAAILSKNARLVGDPLRMVAPLLLVVGPMVILIMLQPDLGTTMVVVAIVFLAVYVVGVRLRTLIMTFLLGTAAGLALIMSAGYRRTRFFAFLHPWEDPRNTGYQIVQSLMAFGSGHWAGVGLGASRQKWMYVPNAHTDFIFSILGEETGLIGEVIVIALFVVLAYAGVRIAVRAPDLFGRLLAAGITGWIAFQAVVNMGSVTGLLPITGVPLPFVSYGGSSLVVSMAAIGVLLSVGRASLRKRPAKRSPRPRNGTKTQRAAGRTRAAAGV
jgi:cell division protein FtsW